MYPHQKDILMFWLFPYGLTTFSREFSYWKPTLLIKNTFGPIISSHMEENTWQFLLKSLKNISVMIHSTTSYSNIAKNSKKQSLIAHVCDQRPP